MSKQQRVPPEEEKVDDASVTGGRRAHGTDTLMSEGPKIAPASFVLTPPDPKTTGGCSVLMIGSGRSGKTTCLKHIMDTYFRKHIGALFSESAKAPAYAHMKYPLMPLSCVFIPELMSASYHINKETKNHYPFLYVLDDVPLAKNDKQLLKLLTIYRNSNISGIICVQSPTLLNPTCRSNFTFVLLFKCNTTEQIEAVIKAYLRGVFPQGWNYDKKIDWYRRATEDHHFLFLNNLDGTIHRCKLAPEQLK
jgi:hypothetical protein